VSSYFLEKEVVNLENGRPEWDAVHSWENENGSGKAALSDQAVERLLKDLQTVFIPFVLKQ